MTSTNFTPDPGVGHDRHDLPLSDGHQGGTFTPSSLTFTGSSAAQTFTYTPASVGPKTLTPTSSNGATVAGSPWLYTPLPAPGSIRFTNYCFFTTAANALLSGQSTCTIGFRLRFNSLAGSGVINAPLVNKQGSFPAFAALGADGLPGSFVMGFAGAYEHNVPVSVGRRYVLHGLVAERLPGTRTSTPTGPLVYRASLPWDGHHARGLPGHGPRRAGYRPGRRATCGPGDLARLRPDPGRSHRHLLRHL